MKTLEEIHGTLQEAFDTVASLHNECDKVSADTAFAIGESLGIIAKAKALVGRDIDVSRESGPARLAEALQVPLRFIGKTS